MMGKVGGWRMGLVGWGMALCETRPSQEREVYRGYGGTTGGTGRPTDVRIRIPPSLARARKYRNGEKKVGAAPDV